MEYKIDSAGRPVYSHHSDFGLLNNFEDVKSIAPKIVDFGSAMRLEKDQRAVSPKRPDYYRPPEATLGCGWDHNSDISMLGVLASPCPFTLERRLEREVSAQTWNFIERTELFKHYTPNDTYCARHHLAEMIALLGPPFEELTETSDRMIVKEFPITVRRQEGSLVHNALQMFNGPFFEDGKSLHNDLIPSHKLEDTLPSLDKDEKVQFLDFIKGMLAWIPTERKTARELMEHPFLEF